MKILTVALQVELIKLRRTLAFWLMLIAPLSIVGLTVLFDIRLAADVSGADRDAWSTLIRDTLGFWVVLMLPLFIALESALLAQLEHGQNMWKHLFALPIPRWTVYTAKLLISILIVGMATVFLFLGVLGAGGLIQALHLRTDFHWGPPDPSWATALRTTGLVFLLSWGMIALQTYVSMRWSSFTVTLGVGIMGSIATFIFVRSLTLAAVLPWLLPFNALDPYIKQGAGLVAPLMASSIFTIVLTVLGAWDLSRKDIL